MGKTIPPHLPHGKGQLLKRERVEKGIALLREGATREEAARGAGYTGSSTHLMHHIKDYLKKFPPKGLEDYRQDITSRLETLYIAIENKALNGDLACIREAGSILSKIVDINGLALQDPSKARSINNTQINLTLGDGQPFNFHKLANDIIDVTAEDTD